MDVAVRKFEDYDSVNKSVANQWESLVEMNKIPIDVRTLIASSWSRCLSENINPLRQAADNPLSESRLENKREENGFLLKVAAPYINELYQYIDNEFALIMLSDAKGLTLQGQANPRTWSKVEEINFIPGTDWSETGSGTNAIGTAIVENRPVQIFANEHFCQGWHHLICSAAPIRDSLTNQIIGVIDLTGEKNLITAHNLHLVMNQAKKIEQKIQFHIQEQNETLMEKVFNLVKKPMVIFDKTGLIRKRNHAGTQLFESGDSLASLINSQLFGMLSEGATPQTTLCTHKGKRWKVNLYPYRLDHHFFGGLAFFKEESTLDTKVVSETNFNCNTFDSIVTNHPQMITVIEKAKKAAKMDQDLLITGESGVGKDVLVRAIQAESSRANKPFVSINCGALPRELMASELFGHRRGAFTGADPRGKRGKFVYADQGCIFLDEIAELPLESQAYLLRVLEEREVVPLGGNEAIPVNVRIIAATNKELEKEVQRGRFRQDLFYRINVLHIDIPPLRNRKSDIPLLVNHFLGQKKGSVSVTSDALNIFHQYHWPGNIRQLKHVLDQALLNDVDNKICINDLPDTITRVQKDQYSTSFLSKPIISKEVLQTALNQTGYNIAETARYLQVSRTTIYKKMKEYKLKD